jgi:hypothetical protein
MGKILNRYARSLFIFASFLVLSFFVPVVKAAEVNTSCSNRYLTLVNPVRGRNLWSDSTLSSLINQYAEIKKYSFSATWLLQYDALNNGDLINEVLSFDEHQEKGVFLEVSRDLTDDSGVSYPIYDRWSDPGAVFLSAYSLSQRRLIIDTLYSKFKKIFGYYPNSIGAWWIDSYSLDYIKNKYGLDAVMIVAPQKTTDSYGVWGQWWGVPYYLSVYNVLVPDSGAAKLDPVVIQWAQRDPLLGYGDGPSFSNFSLQANDYIRSGKDTNYFINLARQYLDCRNSIGQITVGLETGMESVGYFSEYQKQLQALSQFENLQSVTMSDFSRAFRSIYKDNPPEVVIGQWVMTPNYIENKLFNERINYTNGLSFGDFFIADNKGFLDRNLSNLNNKSSEYFPWFIVLAVLACFTLALRKRFGVLVWSAVFGLVSYGLVFRSFIKYGWEVLYGPITGNLIIMQLFLVAAVLLIAIYFFSRKKIFPKLLVWLIPLSWGVDWFLSLIRFTKIQGAYYFGVITDKLYFVGIEYNKSIHLVVNKYSPNVAEALLRLPFEKIWGNQIFAYILYPLIHVVLAIIFYAILKKLPNKIRNICVFILILGFIFQIMSIFKTDPRVIFPVK